MVESVQIYPSSVTMISMKTFPPTKISTADGHDMTIAGKVRAFVIT